MTMFTLSVVTGTVRKKKLSQKAVRVGQRARLPASHHQAWVELGHGATTEGRRGRVWALGSLCLPLPLRPTKGFLDDIQELKKYEVEVR